MHPELVLARVKKASGRTFRVSPTAIWKTGFSRLRWPVSPSARARRVAAARLASVLAPAEVCGIGNRKNSCTGGVSNGGCALSCGCNTGLEKLAEKAMHMIWWTRPGGRLQCKTLGRLS